jgi:predicted small lipoprotein YifL
MRFSVKKSALATLSSAANGGSKGPCFPVVLVGALHFMRSRLAGTALATLSSAADGGSKGLGWEINPEDDLSARGAALNAYESCARVWHGTFVGQI